MVNSTTDEFAVRTTGLTVARGGTTILDSLDLAVTRGEITGLLGPSGSGKTTLMRTLVGVQRHTGTATVLGAAAGSSSLRRRIGYVTQSGSIYSDLTAGQNVRYFAELFGRPTSAVGPALDSVGMTGYTDRLVSTLSGGQAGRVSLACALVAEPDLLVLDEPTVGLDPVLRVELWRHFRELAQGGTTLLVSSHVMDEAEHCDDVLVLRDGALLAAGAPRDLMRTTGTSTMEDAFLALVDSHTDVGSPTDTEDEARR